MPLPIKDAARGKARSDRVYYMNHRSFPGLPSGSRHPTLTPGVAVAIAAAHMDQPHPRVRTGEAAAVAALHVVGRCLMGILDFVYDMATNRDVSSALWARDREVTWQSLYR
jgi:hypothetical protein